MSPQKHVIPHALSVTKPCFKNIAKYNGLLIGQNVTTEFGAKDLKVDSDSILIVNQARRKYKVWNEDLIPYYEATSKMEKELNNFYIRYLPHQQNANTDALASLAAFLALSAGAWKKILVFTHNIYCPSPLANREQALTKVTYD